MKVNNLKGSITLAVAVALTASATASFSESEASLQAQSQSSTMNTSQPARETGSSSATQNNSQSSNEQTSQASTHNNSNGNSEAVGGSLGGINQAHTPAQLPASSTTNYRAVTNAPQRKQDTTTSISTVASGSPVVRHTPHTVTRSYVWKNARNKRGFSTAYMQKTIRQAAITR